MTWLENLLKKDLVIEIHRRDSDFFCLVTRGKDRCGTGRMGPDLRAIIEEAAADVLGETKPFAALGEEAPVKKRSGEIDLSRARELVKGGATIGTVAKEMGVTRATLYHRLRKGEKENESEGNGNAEQHAEGHTAGHGLEA